jgi:hypothetical protein
MSWWVSAISYPATPDTASPYYVQADSESAAEKIIGGKPLAGPFTTRLHAVQWATGPGASNFGKGKTNIAKPQEAPILPGGSGLLSPFKGLEAIGAFFNKLSEANTWLRIGEGFLGVILIAVGLAKLTGVENFITKNMPAVIPI